MARRPDRIRIEVFAPASDAETAKEAFRPSDDAVRSLAHLIGRQMAREQFERARAMERKQARQNRSGPMR
ncbi:hypothetical protein GLI01_32350 [Gluconacetobacter liquefaciens]|uniref:Uncharacterized protein n=1 Tax=Gluconacetobacter liquefaciens TaxID=89584 RepID=A0A370FSZ7_GLULI|nr:hypothetical protein [Gluconacetobacter liquefaciens]MBB2187821.1 hypothetical protein [Gluconacetobacter liquefaciens]RDI32712.1 hypothetical protein C7453_1194 [Gluconacetobacter liquefaciens]GBR02420.1 hypothetical protein AA0522_1630 [Gluconacetobacter liquefaciens NRIC 0522]GEB39200.1 hypothetical protein GLI01_32350 [Gluconacetobacter liquefaciens]